MNFLFIIALLLAWPTFGISLVLWFIWQFVNTKNATDKVAARREIEPLLEAVFTNRHAEFFNALNLPIKYGHATISPNEAHQCGRHIMNYIGHNRSELQTFISGLKRWEREDGQICHPADAVAIECRLAGRGEVYAVSLRAVEAIITRNSNLRCFQSVDFARLKAKILEA